ncbi:uroporphyrinogen-III synthase [Pasteurella canis]|uniref:Uroporphyrinogen-III synthase n=1 Tax=Pasteurella canis TaxID=753 RepID=A0A379EVZ8_9PAST|nr:uroporphyrinogen-III synthase [Pasteurella canis]UAX41652.1 uroporphyrinogen-III synthase [Pasteurella canis]UAY77159.1 uroporphyrinogen-III synthase [Pasteurella canis]UDW83209.1 uroporphyrinogen-III synthase [Pasteurella canis]UEC22737.1 uroporphyrinogen-III synthase [Pasteurella canis]SPY38506.1 uroporphyrinogen-III synthase [Pasteurella canis]
MAVLVTRPDERGAQLVDMLIQAGVFAIHLPLFTIEAGRELNALPHKFSQLKAGDYVFAVSKHAVAYATQTFKDTGFAWRHDLSYFAVGQRTAEYFASQTEHAIYYPQQTETSEGVLELALMQDVAEKSVLILRGNGGREYFSEQIQLRGAKVDTVECYQRVPINYNNVEQMSICKRAGIQRIVATSAEILQYLVDFVPESEHNWLKSCQLVTVSSRLAKLAHNLGWHNVVVSPRADNQHLLQTLLHSS